MSGYYKRPDLTQQAIRDGWLHSGDLGYVDEDGFLFMVDRVKDMMILEDFSRNKADMVLKREMREQYTQRHQ